MELEKLMKPGFNLIDKCGKINKTTFKQIIKNKSKVMISYGNASIDADVDTLLVELFSNDIPDNKDFIIFIYQDNNAYAFTGKDFNWFLKIDRLSDLSNYVYGYDMFSSNDNQAAKSKQIKQIKANDASEYHIGAVSTKDIENPVVHDFKGTKQECLKWLNHQIVQNANLENEVEMLICLDYDAEEKEWKTLKELFDEGKIDVC